MYQKRSQSFEKPRGSSLVRAAQEGDIHSVAEIISAGSYTPDEYRAAVMKSAGFGHEDLTKALCELPDNNNYVNVAGTRMATQYGRESIFRYFISTKGVDLATNNGLFVSVASQFGKLNILNCIKSLGFSFESAPASAFENACRHMHDKEAAFLVKEGAPFTSNPVENKGYGIDHHERQDDEYDSVYRAASRGDEMLETFHAMLERGLPYEVKCKAMVKAASYGQIKLLKLLTDNSADINYDNVVALSESARFNRRESIDFILNLPECDKKIGLQRAIKKATDYMLRNAEEGQELVNYLVEHALLNEDSGICASSMMVRCLNGRQWSAALQVLKICPWVSEDEDITSRIVKFCKDEALIAFLLSEPIDFDAQPWVDIALEYGNFLSASMLMARGLKIQNPTVALMNSAKFGSLEFVKKCIELNGDVGYNNHAAVNLACQNNHHLVEQYLSKLGEKPNEASLIIAQQNREDQNMKQNLHNNGRGTSRLHGRQTSSLQ